MTAGWKVDPTQRHQLRFWNGMIWTADVADNGVSSNDPYVPLAPPPPPPPGYHLQPPQVQTYPQPYVQTSYPQQPYGVVRADPGFLHFLRFLLMFVVVYLSCALLVGFVWLAFILAATGRRKRDLLMLLIPVWSLILLVQTLWRISARNVYWATRPDMISKTYF